MKQQKRKGFTLVELLVVIAILAILATVSIVGYTQFIKKAHISNDLSLITQINRGLEADEMASGKPATLHDVRTILAELGYDLPRLTPTTEKHHYVWNYETNRFLLIDDKLSVVAPDGAKLDANKSFAVAHSEEELENWQTKGFSTYLADDFVLKESNTDKTLTVVHGIDTGNCTKIEAITYNPTAEQENVIRTNGEKLTVNAPLASISHYGTAENVVITAVADHSYVLYGQIAGNIEVTSGRVVVTSQAKANAVVVSENAEASAVKVEVQNGETKVKVPENVTVDVQGIEPSNVKMVTKNDNLSEAKGHVVLAEDITGNVWVYDYDLDLDLNGHTIHGNIYSKKNLTISGNGQIICTKQAVTSQQGAIVTINGATITATNPGNVGIWASGGEVIINDATIEASEQCVLVYNAGKVTINGGEFTSIDNAVVSTNGGNGLGGNTITINGGIFNANIKSSGYIACGIYLANSDTLTVNGGVFNVKNGCGILCRSGNSIINDCVINLSNDGTTAPTGKVGDSKVMVLSGAYIVQDLAANYIGGVPTVTNNTNYVVYQLEAYKK